MTRTGQRSQRGARRRSRRRSHRDQAARAAPHSSAIRRRRRQGRRQQEGSGAVLAVSQTAKAGEAAGEERSGSDGPARGAARRQAVLGETRDKHFDPRRKLFQFNITLEGCGSMMLNISHGSRATLSLFREAEYAGNAVGTRGRHTAQRIPIPRAEQNADVEEEEEKSSRGGERREQSAGGALDCR